jgi:hypothetical protein
MKKLIISLFLSVFVLSACQGLGGEPRIIATIVPPTNTPEPQPTTSTNTQQAPVGIVTPTESPVINLAPSDLRGDGVVVGRVRNGTVNESISAPLDVVLVMVDLQDQRTVFETTTDETGMFQFEGVPFIGGNLYFTATEYQGVPYFSETVSASPNMSQVESNLMVYETTGDPSALLTNSIFTQLDAAGDFLEITETIGLLNRDSRTYLTDQTLPDGRRVSLQFNLPPGAVFIGSINDPTAFYDTQTGVVSLTNPVYSGQSIQVVLQYLMPYDRGAIIEYPLNYGINGAAGLLITSPVLNATADWIQTDEYRDMNGQNVRLLGGPLTISAGDVIRYEVSGQARQIGTSQEAVITSDNLLVVTALVAVILVVFVLGIGYVLRRGRKPAPNKDVMIDRIIRQIAQIEAEHEQGTLNHDVYQRRKAELEALLAQVRGDGS